MLAALDTTLLTLFIKPDVQPPNDPNTGKPVHRAAERVQYLMQRLEESDSTLIIPATVWAEFLVIADEAAQEYLAVIKDKAFVRIMPFDHISSVEAAIDQRRALKAGNRQADFSGTRQCLKADRQIVAIAKTNGVDMLYTGDQDIVRIGASMNVSVTALWDMDPPPSSTPLFDETE